MFQVPASLRSTFAPKVSVTDEAWQKLTNNIRELGAEEFGFVEAVESHLNFCKGQDESEIRARFLVMIFDVYSKLVAFVEKKAYSLEQ